MTTQADDVAREVEAPRRLDALLRTGLLDSPAEETFDRATRLASAVLDAPVALVSLVDDHRQFFKSAQGLPEPWASRRETPLTHSFCKYVVARDDALRVADARDVDFLRDNEAVADLGVIAYLGVPLHDRDGEVLGSFCVIDGVPRTWTDEHLDRLRDLSALVRQQLDLRARASDLQDELRHREDVLSVIRHGLLRHVDLATVAARGVRAFDGLPEQARDLVDVVTDQLDGVGALVRAPFAEGWSADEVVPLSDVVDEVLDRLDGRRARVRGDIAPSLAVRSERGALTHLLHDLLDNALRHTAPASPVEVTGREAEGRVTLTVADAGPGFDPGHRGAGLGLVVVSLLARRLRAEVSIDSRPGGPTRIGLSLPPVVDDVLSRRSSRRSRA